MHKDIIRDLALYILIVPNVDSPHIILARSSKVFELQLL